MEGFQLSLFCGYKLYRWRPGKESRRPCLRWNVIGSTEFCPNHQRTTCYLGCFIMILRIITFFKLLSLGYFCWDHDLYGTRIGLSVPLTHLTGYRGSEFLSKNEYDLMRSYGEHRIGLQWQNSLIL